MHRPWRKRGRFLLAGLLATSCALSTSCFTLRHTVGGGPSEGEVVETKQWHAGWGLVPMNPVDSASLAGGASDYRVVTEFTFADVLVSSITSFVGFYRQTVQVEK